MFCSRNFYTENTTILLAFGQILTNANWFFSKRSRMMLPQWQTFPVPPEVSHSFVVIQRS